MDDHGEVRNHRFERPRGKEARFADRIHTVPPALPRYYRMPYPCPVRRVLLAVVPIAGFQHHHGMHHSVLRRLRKGRRLRLVREPDNPHDAWAIALHTRRGEHLGYIPRTSNRPIARMIDQGMQIVAMILKVETDAEPWNRVSILIGLEIPEQMLLSEN